MTKPTAKFTKARKLHDLLAYTKSQKSILAVSGLFVVAGFIGIQFSRAASTTISVNDNTIGTSINQWQYSGSWTYYADSSAKYNGDDHGTNTTDSEATLKFSGTQVRWYGTKYEFNGGAGVSIDGGSETTITAYAATRTDNTLLFTSPVLTNGTHTITIRANGMNGAGGGHGISVDRAEVVTTTGSLLYVNEEAENGTLSGSATKIADPTASAGNAVKFQTPVSTGGGGGTGTWWSGESDISTVQNGTFASWRGRSVEVGGAWAATNNASNAVDAAGWVLPSGSGYGNVQRMDWAIGAMLDNSGENWGAAANGAYKTRWAQQLTAAKNAWGSRDPKNFYIRFAHEFNGNWYPWSVSTGDVNNFNAAWKIFYATAQANFPGAKVVWCPNAGSSWNYDIRSLYPGDAYVDIVGVDSYNNYPWTNTQAEFDSKAASVSSFGGPTGLESFRQFAQAHGKPMAINEWSNAGIANQGGGGESPQFMQSFHDWLTKNGSQTSQAGKVLYEVLFNVTGYGDHYSLYPYDAESGNTTTADKYRDLW